MWNMPYDDCATSTREAESIKSLVLVATNENFIVRSAEPEVGHIGERRQTTNCKLHYLLGSQPGLLFICNFEHGVHVFELVHSTTDPQKKRLD